jgi:hypothetical protein
MPWLFGRDWAAGEESFPRLLRWALMAAPLIMIAAWFVPYSTRDAVRIVMILLYAASALCALLAVPTAVSLLAFKPQYRNGDNVVMTLIAAIPFVLAAFALLLWVAITITGGSLH